eukprot:106908-Pelagomonas_calceolata.AAC.9
MRAAEAEAAAAAAAGWWTLLSGVLRAARSWDSCKGGWTQVTQASVYVTVCEMGGKRNPAEQLSAHASKHYPAENRRCVCRAPGEHCCAHVPPIPTPNQHTHTQLCGFAQQKSSGSTQCTSHTPGGHGCLPAPFIPSTPPPCTTIYRSCSANGPTTMHYNLQELLCKWSNAEKQSAHASHLVGIAPRLLHSPPPYHHHTQLGRVTPAGVCGLAAAIPPFAPQVLDGVRPQCRNGLQVQKGEQHKSEEQSRGRPGPKVLKGVRPPSKDGLQAQERTAQE